MRKIYTKITALISLACLTHLAHGQSNYLPGRIVMPQGDTISGLIDYRNWAQNPKKVFFKKDIAGAATTYSTSDIKAFKVNDELYERGFINIETSPYKLEELDNSSTPQLKADTTFLRAIVQGTKSLYYYKTKNDQDFYYIKSEGTFELLVHKKYKETTPINTSNTRVVKDNTFYLNQLSLYLKNCPQIQSRLRNTQYTKSSLTSAFKYYYTCTNESSVISSSDKTRNQLGVVVGPSLATIHFKGVAVSGETDYNSNKPVAGIYWNVFLPRNLSRFSSYNELLFSSYAIKGRFSNYTNPDNYENIDFKISYGYLKLNTMLRYKQPLGKASVFVNAGISNGYAVSETNEAVATKKFYSTEQTTKGALFSNTSKYEQGFLLGVGTGVKKLSGEIRYERSNGFIDIVGVSNNVERYSFLLGYSF